MTTTKTYQTIQDLRDALPGLPEDAVIKDRCGVRLGREGIPHLAGDFAPYTVTYDRPFQAGDKVRVEPGEESAYGATPLDYSEVRKVEDVYDDGMILLAWTRREEPTSVFHPDSLILVASNTDTTTPSHRTVTPAPLDPSAVEAGDTVTVDIVDPDLPEPYTVAGKVTGALGGHLAVGMSTLKYNGEWDDRVTLTAHTPAPEPEPAFQFGTALVDGERRQGFLTGGGENFVFPLADRGYAVASGDAFENFEVSR